MEEQLYDVYTNEGFLLRASARWIAFFLPDYIASVSVDGLRIEVKKVEGIAKKVKEKKVIIMNKVFIDDSFR